MSTFSTFSHLQVIKLEHEIQYVRKQSRECLQPLEVFTNITALA